MLEPERGAAKPGASGSKSGSDARPEKSAAEPKSKTTKASTKTNYAEQGTNAAKTTEAEHKANPKRVENGVGLAAENWDKTSGTKAEKAHDMEESKVGNGKKEAYDQKNENEIKDGDKKDNDKKDDDKKDDDKKEIHTKENGNDNEVKEDNGKKDGKKGEENTQNDEKENDKRNERSNKGEDRIEDAHGVKDGNTKEEKVAPSAAQKLDELMKLWTEFQSTTRESSTKIQKLESTLITLENSLDRFGKFCGEYQLIWKVKNINEKFEEARSGERPIIYSPAFDTHRSGYKLQLSLCPNGDGKGYGVAMSLFFAILKGPYDPLLQWPFTCPVTMTLLEQVPDMSVKQPRDVTMTFIPNSKPDNAPFLGKPVETKNLSLGFQKFILLTDLYEGDYIQDDSIFIKVYVDISNVMAL